MSLYESQFTAHHVHITLKEVEDVLSQRELYDENIDTLAHIDRVSQLVRFLKDCFGSLNPVLVSVLALNNIDTYLGAIKNELLAFISDRDAGHFRNINDSVHNILTNVPALAIISGDGVKGYLTESIIDFHESAERLIASALKNKEKYEANLRVYETKADVVGGRLDDVIKAIEVQKSELQNYIARKDSEIKEIMSARSEEFAAFVGRAENDISSVVEEKRNEIDALMRGAKSDFDDMRSGASNSFEDKFSQLERSMSEIKDSASGKANDIISEMEAKRTSVRALLGIIGNDSITGHQRDTAKEERRRADFFRAIAFLMFMFLAIVMAFSLLSVDYDRINWMAIFNHFVLIFLLGGPASYAMAESNKHRKNEQYYKRIELELASLDPFVAGLDKEMQQQIKTKLTEKYFGQSSPPEHKEDTAVLPIQVISDLLKELAKQKVK